MNVLDRQNNARAWRTGIGAIMMAISQLVPWNSFSIFLRPISESMGVAVGYVSIIFSLSAVGGLITALSIGSILKKIDNRIIIAIGGCTLALFFITVSVSSSMIPIYIVSVIHGFGGVAAGFTMAQIILSQWFDRLRGTMLGACMVCMSLAGAILVPVMGTLIVEVGYRTLAFWEGIIGGGLVLLIGVFLISGSPDKYGMKPHGYVERDTGAAPATSADGKVQQNASLTFGQIIRFPIFWIVILMTLMATMAAQSFNSQGANYFQSIGLNAIQASYALSIFMFAGMVWALLFGQISDRISPTVAALINGSVAAFGFLFSFMWLGWTGAIIAAICFAAGGSVTSILGPALMAKVFGTKEAGNLVGFVRAGSSVGGMIGPIVSGFLFSSTGSYVGCFTVMGGIFVVILILNVWAGSKKTIANIKAKQNALLTRNY